MTIIDPRNSPGQRERTAYDGIERTEGEKDVPGFRSERRTEDNEEAAEEAEELEVNLVIREAVEHANMMDEVKFCLFRKAGGGDSLSTVRRRLKGKRMEPRTLALL
jgi:hypothetical protein